MECLTRKQNNDTEERAEDDKGWLWQIHTVFMEENVTIKSIILCNKYMIIKTRKIIKDYTVKKSKEWKQIFNGQEYEIKIMQ